ncbi:MAG TPA: FKBP-type peptidyl-prolyl cis-trans isomerase [Vicingus sp.]|nr:FKBP-type peptidyl-prolyl cis-trans isomerase [Vicingus sp.]HRP60705.1 FKBP-type peptidyl-prolyl cis-trans isomerase [Vicingus sp.]
MTKIKIFQKVTGIVLATLLIYSCSSLTKKRTLVGKEFKTESGLIYTITHEGNGKRAAVGDKVSVHYTGKLTNDSIFDSSLFRNQPFNFKLGEGQVIKGWDEGIALLNVGDKATFTIPPHLAYGSQGAGGVISPNETLIFEVELLNIIEAPKPFDVAGKDTITTSSGLKYIKLNTTEGIQAQAGKIVKVHYSGYLENGKMFDSSVERGQPLDFPLGQGRVIKGWDEGIALLKVGEKARLIIPQELGYGERGYPPIIPAKATLLFDVELIDVK